MEKKFVKAGQLKAGNFVLIDEVACRITSFEKSKAGKHGSAKARIVGTGIFDGSKRTLLIPTAANAAQPIIKRGNAQVVAVMGDSLQLMDMESYENFTVPYPKEVGELQGGDEVEYMKLDENVKVVRKK